jgi:hypothetical protein
MSFSQTETDRVEDAKRQLTKDPCDLNSLGMLIYSIESGFNCRPESTTCLDSLAEYSTQGLRCLNESRSGTQSEYFDERRFLISFNGEAGFAALQNKHYDRAQPYLRAAVNEDPSNLKNVYRLAIAYLQATPPQNVEGLFFLARAETLAQHNSSAQNLIQNYAIRVYRNYHGSKDGWETILHTAKKNGTPPAGFTITKVPIQLSIP